MNLQSIAHNIAAVRREIASAAAAAGRRAEDIRLIAVSKTQPAAAIRAAAAAGCLEFGENYLAEAGDKQPQLADLPLTWHFIGAIQSNKTRQIAEGFQWVHGLSRQRIARRLSAQLPPGRMLDVCIQVNVDQDPDKAGVEPGDAAALLADIRTLPNLRPRGLMTILRRTSAPSAGYRRLAELFEALRPAAGEHWDTLSMGMSGDYREAIAAGATQIRIGTAIFGSRA